MGKLKENKIEKRNYRHTIHPMLWWLKMETRTMIFLDIIGADGLQMHINLVRGFDDDDAAIFVVAEDHKTKLQKSPRKLLGRQ